MIVYRNNLHVLYLPRGRFTVLLSIIKCVPYDCYHCTKNINISNVLKMIMSQFFHYGH